MWPNSPAMAFAPCTSLTVERARRRQSPPRRSPRRDAADVRRGCRTTTSPSAHALAAFSTLTGSSVAASSICRRSTSRQPRFGAKTSRPVASTRPGRLTPMPSHTIRGYSVRRLATVRATSRTNADGIGWGRKRPLGFEPRIDVGQSDGRRLGPKVDPDDARALDVEVQESRPPAPRQPADGAFGDPAFFDQLIDDRRHGAALQARAARQIRPRHRLVMAEEIERNPPVNLARGLARGDLKVRQIDLAHGFGELYQTQQSTVGSRRSSVTVLSPSRQSQSAVPVGSPSRQSAVASPSRPSLVDSRRRPSQSTVPVGRPSRPSQSAVPAGLAQRLHRRRLRLRVWNRCVTGRYR